MHLSIKSQTKDGKPAVMCVEKPIRTCVILSATPEEAETFATLAQALGVSEVLWLAPRGVTEDAYHNGWIPQLENVTLCKRLGKS